MSDSDVIVINDDLRTMTIPSSISILGVESDDDVNKIPFQMPKTYCGFDLSTFEARINYMNANGDGDVYIVDDLEEDEDDPSLMNFTWLVGRTACMYEGNTKFIVCLKKFDENDNVVQEFNTTVYNLPVLEGLETTDAVQQQNADIIEYILTLIDEMGGVDLSNYYTKTQVDALKLANPYPLTINGTEYDGSEAVDMTIQGSSSTTETASGVIIHVEDAVASEAVESLSLYDSNGSAVNSAVIAIANKNLFRIDALADQTVSKGVTFEKNSNGAIHATGTSSGTYATAGVSLDKNAFVVGETYTLSSGKTSGVLYLQLTLNYTDSTTDYLVASNSPYTFELTKEVSSVLASVQLTNSGVTVDEWIYPMIELSDMASPFTMNTYTTMTYTGSTMPVLPDSICNVWSNDDTVANMIMEYWYDPTMAKVNELEKQFYQTYELDGEMNSTSSKAVQNKAVTAALVEKVSAYQADNDDRIQLTDGNGNWYITMDYQEALSKYEELEASIGSPLVANTASAMTDTTKIYVYTGSESGYTNGDWYYYYNGAWNDGGVYNSVAVGDYTITSSKLASGSVTGSKLASGIKTTMMNVLTALLQIAEKVAYIDEYGQDYYDDLEDAKDALYDALYPPANLVSISAVYTQSGTVYDTDSLDDLESDLVVTATYDDGTTATISDYVLSGTLSVGTSTITVTYGGQIDTFTVVVTKSLDYTEDALTNVTWTDGYTYDTSTGVLTASNNEHCTDKFTAQDCIYNFASSDANNKYVTIFSWDENGNYLGYNQATGRFSLVSGYTYAVKAYNTSTFDQSSITLLPVDNRSTSASAFEIKLSDYVNNITDKTSYYELDVSSVFTAAGITTSNFSTKINKCNQLAYITIAASAGVRGFVNRPFAFGFYNLSALCFNVPSIGTGNLSAVQTYITNNDIRIKFNE